MMMNCLRWQLFSSEPSTKSIHYNVWIKIHVIILPLNFHTNINIYIYIYTILTIEVILCVSW